jgi:hypothetical protein
MLIIRNKRIPIAGFSAMNILGILFVRKEARIDKETIRHEAIHTAQQYEIMCLTAIIALIGSNYYPSWWYLPMTILMPIALYIVAWLIELILPPFGNAYKDSPFEREAYANEKDSEYLAKRPFFAWVKYFIIKKRFKK